MSTQTPVTPEYIPEIPDLPEVQLRGFCGESDYPKMVAVINASKVADQIERSDTVETLRNAYSHLHNCDPYQDMLFAEVEGQVVGYIRCWWDVESANNWLGWHVSFLHPDWRNAGIDTAFLHFSENRLRKIADGLRGSEHLPDDRRCYFTTTAHKTEVSRATLLEREEYQAVRWEYMMVRSDLENIPEAPLPAGLDVRPVRPEHLRAIYDANVEAFQDHWGYIPPSDQDFDEWVNHPEFDASHYQVAWDGDQVAGMVLAFISPQENEEYQRRRGWTEGICVRRPYRRQGLARALLVRSLHDLKASGMEEAALTVDTQNLNSAFRLYESVGFRPYNSFAFYRKEF